MRRIVIDRRTTEGMSGSCEASHIVTDGTIDTSKAQTVCTTQTMQSAELLDVISSRLNSQNPTHKRRLGQFSDPLPLIYRAPINSSDRRRTPCVLSDDQRSCRDTNDSL